MEMKLLFLKSSVIHLVNLYMRVLVQKTEFQSSTELNLLIENRMISNYSRLWKSYPRNYILIPIMISCSFSMKNWTL